MVAPQQKEATVIRILGVAGCGHLSLDDAGMVTTPMPRDCRSVAATTISLSPENALVAKCSDDQQQIADDQNRVGNIV
jgi:hypothetical protein